MPFLGAACDFLGVLAGLAAFCIVSVFFLVTLTRKSSLAWINVHFSLVAVAIGSECLANVQAPHQTLAMPELCSRALLYIAVILCAILSVPLYRRVRRHRQFDEIQAANRQLEYSKRLFKTFLDETPFAAYVVDSKERFVYVNSHTARDHNVTFDQMVQTTYDKWFSPEIAKRLVAQNATVLASGQRQDFVNDVVLASGKATYLSCKFPLPGPHDDQLLGVVSLEISEELKAKAADSLLAKIVKLSPDAIYTCDQDQKITSWNNAAEKIFGYTAAEIIGQPVATLAPPVAMQDVADVIARLARGEIIKDQKFVHRAKDGTRKHLSLSATKIKSFPGVGESYAAIARDQTEARRAASEMKALNRALDARVAALSQANKELPLARDQALDALELRSVFAASMSHAIRTPLSGILGLSELLLDKDLDVETADTLQTILDSSKALLVIVNDILDLSKLEDDAISMEEQFFNPAALINDCIKLLQPGATSKQIKIYTTFDSTLPEQA
jgi:PAS domain S-box-containing protein